MLNPLKLSLSLLLLGIAPGFSDPTALRPDIQILKIMDVGDFSMRIVKDPLDDTLYYMNLFGDVFRINLAGSGSTSLAVFGSADHGQNETNGFAIGPDGTMYLVGRQVVLPDGTPDPSGVHQVATIVKGVVDAGTGNRNWSTLAETDPYELSDSWYNHNFNGIVVSPDGSFVYVNSGSRTEHGEVQDNNGSFPLAREVGLTAIVLRLPTTGADIGLPNDREALRAAGYLFAEGVRNSFDLAFSATGDLFAPENGPNRDMADELNWLREGHHYGFPWRMGNADNPQQFPGYDPTSDPLLLPSQINSGNGLYSDDPGFPPPPLTGGQSFTPPVINIGPDADKFRDPITGTPMDASDLGQTLSSVTPHRSPLGMVFDVEGALAAEFQGDGFFLSFNGSNPLITPLGDPAQDLVHADLVQVGANFQAQMTRLVGDFDQPIDAEIIGNAIYVLEWGGDNSIWEITLPAASTSGDEYVVDANTLALYHFNGDGSDATGGPSLSFSGNTGFIANPTWMSAPSGQAVSLTGAGDLASVLLPDALLMPGPSLTPLTVEAWICPTAYLPPGSPNARMVSLYQSWDAFLLLQDLSWSGPEVKASGTVVVDGTTWLASVALDQWQLLRLTLDSSGLLSCYVDEVLLNQQVVPFNAGGSGTWQVDLGNFVGKIDEVRFSNIIRSGGPPPAPNTPVGTAVVVQPPDQTAGGQPVTLTFDQVTAAGTSTLATAASGPTPPTGFMAGVPATYYDLSTTAIFTAQVEVCIDYDESAFTDESSLALFHYEASSWIDITTALDVAANSACGSTSTLSPFALFEVDTTPPPMAGDEYVVDANTLALYHFNGDGSDATGGPSLSFSGNTGFIADPTWMSAPSGQAVSLTGAGDLASVLLPDALLMPGPSLTPLTVEAWICPTAYLPPGSPNARMVSLYQSWDAFLLLQDLSWSGPEVKASGTVVVDGTTWLASVALDQWQLLRLTLDSSGLLSCYVDEVLLNQQVVPFNAGGSGTWQVDLGNFVGKIDEVRFSNIIRSAPSAKAIAQHATPLAFDLQPNYPNPFNPSTTILYALDQRLPVRLAIYNALGQEIERLVDAVQEPGAYRVEWRGLDRQGGPLAAGLYIYQLRAEGRSLARTMILAR